MTIRKLRPMFFKIVFQPHPFNLFQLGDSTPPLHMERGREPRLLKC